MLGVTPTPGPVDIPALLAAFHERYPAVELAMREKLSVHLADDLRNDRIDLALVSGIAAIERRGLILTPVAADDLVLVVAQGHRLAGRRSARMADARDEPLIAFSEPATIRRTVADAAGRAGFAPRVQFESGDAHRAVALVAAGLGITVVPRRQVEGRVDVVALPFREREMKYEVSWARREARQLSPAAAQLANAVIAYSG